MGLLTETGMVPPRRLAHLLDEASQLTAIVAASRKSTAGLR